MTIRDGLDRDAFRAALEAATPAERRQLWSDFWAWVREGARAQGAWLQLAGAVSLCVAIIAATVPMALGVTPWLYAVAVTGACITVLIFREAFRRERDWRRRNPFLLRGAKP